MGQCWNSIHSTQRRVVVSQRDSSGSRQSRSRLHCTQTSGAAALHTGVALIPLQSTQVGPQWRASLQARQTLFSQYWPAAQSPLRAHWTQAPFTHTPVAQGGPAPHWHLPLTQVARSFSQRVMQVPQWSGSLCR